MTASPSNYRRLPGRSFNVFHWDTVWYCDDHMLTVRALPGSDAYRRFFFRDIEAIVVRRTRARLWTNLVLLILALVGLFPLAYLLSPFSPDRFFALMAVTSVVPLVLMVVNTVRGPTCDVRIQTAVQFERVAALSRVTTAELALSLLRPLIQQAQQVESATPAPAAGGMPNPR